MTERLRTLLLSALALALFLSMAVAYACSNGNGGDSSNGDGSTPTAASEDITPTAEVTPTPTAAPVSLPDPADLEAPAGVTLLGEGEKTIELSAGQGTGFRIETTLAEDISVEAPACDTLVFLVSWQVKAPNPPDDVTLSLLLEETGQATETVGEGTSGQGTAGCGILELVNDSADPVTVAMKFGIGQSGG